MRSLLMFVTMTTLLFSSCKKNDLQQNEIETNVNNLPKTEAVVGYKMPDETQPHEGTWLQWPHQYQFGVTYRNRLDVTWVAMTKALVSNEKVHIVAYNTTEKTRIASLLTSAGVALTNVDFNIYQTNDVWVRDNGPLFVKDAQGKNIIEDWGFNAWGGKQSFTKDNIIPTSIATSKGIGVVNLNSSLVLEGGAFEIDGNGTFLATKSAILNSNRNKNITQAQAENLLKQYLGVSNFIWLTGQAGLEITDQHIDGFARFGNATTIVTMSNNDLLDYDVLQADIDLLYDATDKLGNPYNFLELPLTKNNVVTAYGKNLGYKGSYVNFYTANNKVLVPNYNDPNDAIANAKIKTLYPNRTVVGIDVRNLYENGGMVHCVTQQQPK